MHPEMTVQNGEDLGDKTLAIANVVRKCVLLGNKKITEALEESPYDEESAEAILELAKLLMHGVEKDIIIDELQMSPELMKNLDKYDLAW